MPEPTRHRGKAALFLPEDMQQLSQLFAETFPTARYYLEPTRQQTDRFAQPRLLIGPELYRIWNAAQRFGGPVYMVTDPHWHPVWQRQDKWPKWNFRPARLPRVRFNGLTRFPPASDIVVSVQLIDLDVSYNPHFTEQARFAGQVIRLLAKVASNRDLEEVRLPDYSVIAYPPDRPLEPLGVWRMVGHAARRWALADPTRLLEYHAGSKTGLRPVQPATPQSP